MEIRTLLPSQPRSRCRIERFLADNGLRYDDMDYYAAVVDDDTDEIVAGGGLWRGIIKCVAVAEGHKGEALANRIVSHLIAVAGERGHHCVRLYTKPCNRSMFESMSFRLLAEAPQAILMETGIGGIERYCAELRQVVSAAAECGGHVKADAVHANGHKPSVGVIVMNANPFTLGHRYLIEQSAKQVERLCVVVVREDCSMFSYDERKAMIGRGIEGISNVLVCEGSDYAVSATTFPTYFLKRVDDATDTQIMLDLDLYRRYIAPALGATVRFVGSEPDDPLTRRYNTLMAECLDSVREIPRLEADGMAVSASRVRRAISGNDLACAARLVPQATVPYIIAQLATQAIRAELDATPKPGLVDCHDSGAHSDMDHALMARSIRAIHPYLVRLALLGASGRMPGHSEVQAIGIEAERAMMESTGGVNTYKGALFSMGLAVLAVAMCAAVSGGNRVGAQEVRQTIAGIARQFPYAVGTHGSKARMSAAGVRIAGALDNARQGYPLLFGSWLPYYAALRSEGDDYALHKTLLRIMCDLDDTNIIYRVGMDSMQRVKDEARHLLDHFSVDGLEAMNRDFVARNISPGGSADMLSLTVFLYGTTVKQ